MAPVTFLYRLVMSGKLFEEEGWSISMHINSNDASDVPPSAFEAAAAAWMARASSRCSSQASLEEIKFNRINPVTGRYFDAGISKTHVVVPVFGAAVQTFPQVTLAVSTRTALTRGRGHAGRFYPPTGALPMESDGRVTALVANDAADSASSMILAFNALVNATGGQVVVFSKIGQNVEPVTAVRVGRVADTMRSRRTSLAEDYQVQALA